MPPAGDSPGRRAIPLTGWLLLFLAIAIGGLLFRSHTTATARWEDVVARLALVQPNLEERVRTMVLADFENRLPRESPWQIPLADDRDGVLANLSDAHLSRVLQVEQSTPRTGILSDSYQLCLSCAVDFLADTAEGQTSALGDALPNVRVVDVSVRLALSRSGFTHELVVEFCQGGAWLDGEVLALLTETFDDWGLEPQLVEHLEP